MTDSEWEGQPHTLIVHSVTLPASPVDDGELDYEIQHPPGCPEEEIFGGACLAWTCELGEAEAESGLAFSLRYSGTPITEPGTYQVCSWGRKYYVWEYGYEYDIGICLIETP